MYLFDKEREIFLFQKQKTGGGCCCSVAKSCPVLYTPVDGSMPGSPSFTVSWSLLKLRSIELVMSSNHLILYHPIFFLPSIFPSIRVFPNELALCIRWPKYWCFSFSLSPSDEYSGLISFKIYWFNLLAIQCILESSPAPHLKASILQLLSFFMVQVSHLYMTPGKTIAFDYTDSLSAK